MTQTPRIGIPAWVGVVLVLTLQLGFGLCAAEPEVIGTVVAMRGDVKAIHPDKGERQLAMKGQVFLRDTIKTGDRGRVQVSFEDETIISLGRSSEMTIAEYKFDPSKEQGAMVTHVKEGVFRVMGGAITKLAPQEFKTTTGTATIGIRGSFYAGRLTVNRLEVVFIGGRGISVWNQAGTVDITTPGYGTVVADPNSGPEAPRQYSVLELHDLLGALNGNGARLGEEVPDLPGQDEERRHRPENDNIHDLLDHVDDIDAHGKQHGHGHGQGGGDTLPPPGGTPPGGSLAMTGSYLGVLQGPVGRQGRGTGDEWWYGVASGTATDGAVTGQAQAFDAELNTQTIPLNLTTVPANPGGSYTGTASGTPRAHAIVLGGETKNILPGSVIGDNLGECALSIASNVPLTIGGQPYSFSELYFFGTAPYLLPTQGLADYSGVGLLGLDVGTGLEALSLDTNAQVNFATGKVIGACEDPGDTGTLLFFYGDVDGDDGALTNLRILGQMSTPGTQPTAPLVIDGNSASGSLYGSVLQGLGLAADTSVLDATGYSTVGSLQLSTGMFKTGSTAASPTGTAELSGFAVGCAADVSGSGEPVFLRNTDAADFGLTLNRESGAVTGTATLTSPDDAKTLSTPIGDNGSAYVHDRMFIAELGTGGGAITPRSERSLSIDSAGSFLVTGAPEQTADPQPSEWLTWGYWTANYSDSSAEANYRVQIPAGYWVAGELTPTSVIDAQRASYATGTYEGWARCTEVASDGALRSAVGTSAWTVFFGPGTLNGNMAFPELNVEMAASANLNALNRGYTGSITSVSALGGRTGAPPAGSTLQGDFYGPNANATAGTFSADMGTGSTKYVGAFTANSTGAP
ncbi:MAG: hypothetical protein A3K19_27825 [Lentisphaerae bacterium RIFOXYB12_FULL_65_16]|nr:MAG: hypothetical protein A3K18_17745 [Lentisphaerae bacterium RIFOXYA12_64_32]OGV88200.1 MAG: hypothetical protein A3K19_27825 [Lentisphaerae bacterium RIFOXYB12_FULL_65_16]